MTMNWGRRSKYGNRRTEYDGVLYDSKAEAEFARTLDICRKASKESDRVVSWERQVAYVVEIKGKKIFTYKADFKVRYADGSEKVYDVKGVRTAVYRIKKKAVEAQFGIEIVEV